MKTFVKEFQTLVPNKKKSFISSAKFISLETQINQYAEENNLEIKNVSAHYSNNLSESSEFARAIVLFQRLD